LLWTVFPLADKPCISSVQMPVSLFLRFIWFIPVHEVPTGEKILSGLSLIDPPLIIPSSRRVRLIAEG